MLPELLNQIPDDQDIGSVTADGAYDTRKCHDAIAARVPVPSYRRAGMPSLGNLQARERSPATKPSMHRDI